MIDVCVLKLSWFSEDSWNVLITFDLVYIIFNNTSISTGLLRKKNSLLQSWSEFGSVKSTVLISLELILGHPALGRDATQGQDLLRYPGESNLVA